jgi:hypothetical protein
MLGVVIFVSSTLDSSSRWEARRVDSSGRKGGRLKDIIDTFDRGRRESERERERGRSTCIKVVSRRVHYQFQFQILHL